MKVYDSQLVARKYLPNETSSDNYATVNVTLDGVSDEDLEKISKAKKVVIHE